MNTTELLERLKALRKQIYGANMFQAATWTTTSLQLITEILKDLSNE